MIRSIITFSALYIVVLASTATIILGQSESQNSERLQITGDEFRIRKIGNRNVREFIGNVLAWQGTAYMKGRRCTHYTDLQRVDFEGNVEIYNNNKWLFAEKVTYYEESQITLAEDNVRLVDTTKTLLASRLKYFEKEEKAIANDSVRLIDEKNRLVLTGDYAEYQRANGYAKITGSPILSKKDSTKTIELTISGTEMEMFDDGARALVKDSVIIERGAVTAVCEEVEYLSKEEKVFLRKDPKARRKWDDLWGDEIVLLLADNEVKAMDIHGKAVVKSKVDTLKESDPRYNYLSGEKIFVWLQDENMDSVWVDGQATSYYHVIEDGEDKGINKVLGDEIRLHFSEGELKRVRVPSSPGTTVGTYYPPSQSSLADAELNEFSRKPPTLDNQSLTVIDPKQDTSNKIVVRQDEKSHEK